MSRPPARTRGLKRSMRLQSRLWSVASSREDAWIETIVVSMEALVKGVASSREDAWIETLSSNHLTDNKVASSREDAWIETE